MKRSVLSRRLVVAVSLLVPLAGCSKPVPPPPPGLNIEPTGNILSGKITCNGEPVPSGGVQLIDKTGRPYAFGRISSDGTYKVPNAPAGPVIITVTAKEMMPPMMSPMNGRGGPGGPGGMPGGPPGMPGGMPGGPPGMPGGGPPGMPGGMRGGPPGGPPGLPGGFPGATPGAPGAEGNGPPGGPPMGGPPGGPPGRPRGIVKETGTPSGKRPPRGQPHTEKVALTPEQEELLEAIDKKYGQPDKSDLRFTIEKGANTFDLNLTVP